MSGGGSFYTMGLKIYDLLAGKLGLGPSKMLNREEALEALPTLTPEGLKGGTIYHDGQFDDARMAVTLAMTCADYGGILLNYVKVTKPSKRVRWCGGWRPLTSSRERHSP